MSFDPQSPFLFVYQDFFHYYHLKLFNLVFFSNFYTLPPNLFYLYINLFVLPLFEIIFNTN